VHVHLNHAEQAVLQQVDTVKSGGFQNLMRKLNQQLDRTGTLALDAEDLERIPRYAFGYKSGGWQARLMAVFARHLGHDLRR
jgi:hypothetical protein